eukprot:TRINITY_DN2957_c1_g1_i2.p1 TRINITY_DN2957_c1_g1~~TRINITY_DN2957_c1_g1_i2.p1  ORF type:complete len:351 (-),score=60.04 TRINITY_DN2957_c1_g1_i2:88-1062(-)
MVRDCRMYEAKYPNVDDVVMVQVRQIGDMGAYVTLQEYNNIEGMILLSELSRRRIRSIAKLIKVGRQEAVMVLRVDTDKGYIDLSKRRVTQEDYVKCELKYNKSKMVHSIMRHVAETTGSDMEILYQQIAWPLYQIYGHAFEAFKVMVADPDKVMSQLPDPESVSDVVKDQLLKNINRKMTPQPSKIRADVELTCFEYDGVLHIQEAMREAKKCSDDQCEVSIKLIAPPLYVLSTQTLDKNQGIDVLTDACEACQKVIQKRGGKLVVKEGARVVSEQEDRLLNRKMEEEMMNNQEVDGDDDDEDEEDVGLGDIDVTAGPALAVS